MKEVSSRSKRLSIKKTQFKSTEQLSSLIEAGFQLNLGTKEADLMKLTLENL